MRGNWICLSRAKVGTLKESLQTLCSNGLGIQLVKGIEGSLIDMLLRFFFFYSDTDMISCSDDQTLGNNLQ